MLATDFTRDDCQVGDKRITYAKLQLEYQCRLCGGRLGLKWNEDYPENWHVTCLSCESHDFVHVRAREQRVSQEAEFVDGLPENLLEIAGLTKPERGRVIFSLSPETVEI